ncbi:MAG: 50S ribosomal protein L3 [Planctomycetota bacterium]
MIPALLGRKVGMTRIFDADGKNIPVTVVEAGPCVVTQVKSDETADGYHAVQLGFEEQKAKHSNFPMIGHAAKAGTTPKRFYREVRLAEATDKEVGEVIDVSLFEGIQYVDVTGTSKGKGTAGVMKRHNFGGQPASHGTERKHRSPGSVGGRSSNLGTGKPKKGIRMAGRMGNERVTTRNHPLVGVNAEHNLLYIKGPLPGGKNAVLFVKKSKTARVKEEA